TCRSPEMAITNIPLFSALSEKMRWHQERQGILAENVANAETPAYRGRDLKAFDFSEHVRRAAVLPLATTTTQPAHFDVMSARSSSFSTRTDSGFDITPDGNNVGLEAQMMR